MRKILAALALAFAVSPAAFGQAYPSKPVRIICPFPPGGAVDIASRAIADALTKTTGQSFIVENKPGAGGNLGGEIAAKSPPDGYTLFMTTSGIQAINPALYAKMNYDPNKDFAPVVALVSLDNVLVVHPSVKVTSVKELIDAAKAQPGKITGASSGSGTSIHMSLEMFKHLTGTDILHIPYKGSAPAVADLLGGQVDIMFDNIPSSLPHIKAGKLRAVATTGAKRSATLPDLPTIAEAGVPGYESGVWFGLVAPTGTPKDVIAKLNADALKAAKLPDFQKRMTDLGYEIITGSPEQMAERIKAEIARWGPVVKASGAKAE
ncbi:MAG: tripartite tricarboxylate transporter substrate binding protein [Burkholderiales bacterium]|jgi:tripartite-type tricarboxylate transporter receptor subunit TctC|nr:tripartite tricarboxylate transporter substrate binding protein [Burkholderiales bacterium]